MKDLAMPFLGLSLLLAACTPAASPSSADGIVITDVLEREVVLDAAPRQIIITGKALFMIADAAYLFPEASERITGLGNAVQGTGNFIPLIDPLYGDKYILEGEASAEQIAALHPDLVILKSYLSDSIGQSVEILGIPVVYVDFETPEQYTRDIAILGAVFQDEARAVEVSDFFQSSVDRIQQVVSTAQASPRTLMLYYNDRDGAVAFNVPPAGWIQTLMTQMAGGDPVWLDAATGNGWTQVTLEQIAAWDADEIFIVSYTDDSAEVVAGLEDDPFWRDMRAVQEGHLHAFPADFYSWDQPDPRWILGLTWLAGRLYPDLFPDLDITAEAQNFFQVLYGLDAAFFEQNILPSFKGDIP